MVLITIMAWALATIVITEVVITEALAKATIKQQAMAIIRLAEILWKVMFRMTFESIQELGQV